jgi:hypothetical protein
MRRLAACLAAAAVAALPASAGAQDSRSLDPSVSTPAGNQYAVPTEEARDDAAPSRRTPRPSGREAARIRTEQGFGSSAVVPGGAGEAQDAPAPAGGSGGSGGGDDSGEGGAGRQRAEAERGGGARAAETDEEAAWRPAPPSPSGRASGSP